MLAVAVLLQAGFVETHQSYYVANLHILCGGDCGLVVYLINVSTQGSVEIEISPCIVVKSQQFEVVHTVAEVTVLQVTGFVSRSCRCLEIFENEVVQFGTDGTLQFQVLVDVPDSFTVETELVFLRIVGVFVNIPVWIHVVRVHTVPVRVLSVFILIGLQPFLIVGSGQCHQVLSDIRLAVAQCRTVLYNLTSIVGTEVYVDFSKTGIGTQVENITAHVRLRDNILVSHVGIGEAYTGMTAVGADDSRICSGKTCTEKGRCIVWNNQVGAFYAVEVFQHVAAVGFRSPALVRIRDGIDAVCSVATHTIYLLYVVPFSQLGIESQGTVVFYAELFFTVCLLGRDEDDSVAGTATVKS